MNPFNILKNLLGRKPELEEIKKLKFEPGHKAPVSGQYISNHGDQRTVTKGEPLPPGPKGRNTWY